LYPLLCTTQASAVATVLGAAEDFSLNSHTLVAQCFHCSLYPLLCTTQASAVATVLGAAEDFSLSSHILVAQCFHCLHYTGLRRGNGNGIGGCRQVKAHARGGPVWEAAAWVGCARHDGWAICKWQGRYGAGKKSSMSGLGGVRHDGWGNMQMTRQIVYTNVSVFLFYRKGEGKKGPLAEGSMCRLLCWVQEHTCNPFSQANAVFTGLISTIFCPHPHESSSGAVSYCTCHWFSACGCNGSWCEDRLHYQCPY